MEQGKLSLNRITLEEGKKIFWLSDVHLGAPNKVKSLEREKLLVKFLQQIAHEAGHVFIMGDLFDFWYEYRYVAPRGYVRILGQLAQMADAGIKLHFFVGNHDMWIRNYFQQELGMQVYFDPEAFAIGDVTFYLAHGDGLGPGDYGYKFLKKIFRNPICHYLFGLLPASIGMGLANYFSRKSREAIDEHETHFWGADKEWLMIHSRQVLEKQVFNYFIYGHRHVPGVHPLPQQATYINLGDWITHFTYAEWDGVNMQLKKYMYEA